MIGIWISRSIVDDERAEPVRGEQPLAVGNVGERTGEAIGPENVKRIERRRDEPARKFNLQGPAQGSACCDRQCAAATERTMASSTGDDNLVLAGLESHDALSDGAAAEIAADHARADVPPIDQLLADWIGVQAEIDLN